MRNPCPRFLCLKDLTKKKKDYDKYGMSTLGRRIYPIFSSFFFLKKQQLVLSILLICTDRIVRFSSRAHSSLILTADALAPLIDVHYRR